MTYTWNTVQDGHEICPYCQRLHAESWSSSGEQLLSSLAFGNLGVIWDLENGYSLVHETHGIPGKCQCFIDCSIEVLWEGTYVDYGLVKLEIEQLRQATAEIAFNMKSTGDVSGQTDIINTWGSTMGGVGAVSGNVREKGGSGIGLFDVYRATQLPGMGRRLLAGTPAPYDILRLGRLTGAAAAVPQALMVLLVANLVINEVKRWWDDVHKAEISAERYRASAEERKKFAQWI